jgi:hypothetical protein
MKKLLVSTVLLLTFTVTYAQLNFGIKAGYNSSLSLTNISSVANGTYYFDNVKNEMWNNFQAGVFARIGLGKKLYFQPELLYNMQKTNYTVTLQDVENRGVSYDKIVNISTYDIPLLVGYKILDLKLLNLRAFAGPKLRFDSGNSSLAFSNLLKPAGSGSTITLDGLKQDVLKSKIGLEVGAGIDVLMLTLDLRYNLIGDMYNPVVNDYNLPSSTFTISLGWKIF